MVFETIAYFPFSFDCTAQLFLESVFTAHLSMKGVIDHISFSASRERTDRLINILKVGVILYGPVAEILFCNKAACEILGLSENEISGQYADNNLGFTALDGSPLPLHMHPAIVALQSRKAVSNSVIGYTKPVTNEKLWLLVNAEPLLDSEKNVKEIICSINDITKQKTTEEKLTLLYQDLERRAFELACSNADLERFVYVATHHLQEPLRLINSFLQLLQQRYAASLDGQATEYIQYAVDGSNRIKKLILDLLEYSKFSIDREGFSLVDMNTVSQQVVKDLSGFIEKYNAQVTIQQLPVIYADAALMQQLLMRLIRNAIKYKSDKQPVINVNSRVKDDNYVFSIQDNGIGISPDYSEKIFNLFQRLHQNESYEGNGVGLAICEKIIRLHRGSIWVESSLGKGSTFHFTIPVKPVKG
jgi:PAS domain S-box-containing protein